MCSSKLPFRSIELWTALVAVLLCAVLAAIRFEVVNDDAFITFVYAKNLAAGQGLVFNAGERVFGTTAPLWAIVLGTGSWASGVAVPVLAKYFAIVCLAATALLLGVLLTAPELPFVGVCLAPPLFFGMSVHWATGNETALLFLLVTLAVWFLRRSRLSLALLMAVLAYLTRGEGILLVPLLIVFWYRSIRRLPRLREIAPAALLILTWQVFAWNYYQALVPNTLLSKTAERYTPSFASDLPSIAYEISGIAEQGVWFGGLLVLGFLGVARRGVEFVAWTTVHILAYSLLGTASHAWYYHSVGLLWALAVGTGASWVLARLTSGSLGLEKLRPVAALGFALALLPACGLLARGHADDRNRYRCYRAVADILRPVLRHGDAIVAQEVGVLGYELSARVLDPDFLIHRRPPEVSRADRMAYLVTLHRPLFLVTTSFRSAGGEILPWLEYQFPGRQPLRLTLERVVEEDAYQAAIFRRTEVVPPGTSGLLP